VRLSCTATEALVGSVRKRSEPRTREDLPAPREGFVLTHYLTASDVDRSRDFYADVLGGQVVLERNPAMIKVANAWIIINEGGGPTPDKPDVTLAPPSDPTKASSFLNIRVADIEACYDEWSAKGAEFLTAPIDRGPEIRCYMRDPDGYLIEVGQSTRLLERGGNLRNQKEEPDERGRVGVFAARKRGLHRVGG
jgi:catechol 2,3-dioxygenase-like lactoylglutathione lyase family enzyme